MTNKFFLIKKTQTINLFFLTILMFVTFNCLGQVSSYVAYRKQKECFIKADSLVSAKKYAEASKLCKKTLKNGAIDDYNTYRFINILIINNEKNKAFRVAKQFRLYNNLLCDPFPDYHGCWDSGTDLDSLKQDTIKWNRLAKFLDKKLKNKTAKLNYPLAVSFKDALIEDQKYRYISITPEWAKLSKQQKDSVMALQQEIDVKNHVYLKQVTEQYGWPGYSMVGGIGTGIILNHAVKDYAYYIPLIEEAATKNEIDWRTVELIKQYYYVGRAELDEIHQIKLPFFKQTKPNLTQEAAAELSLIGDFLRYIGKSLVVIEVVYHGTLPPEKADALSQQRMKNIQSFFEKHYPNDSKKIVVKYRTFIPSGASEPFPSTDNSVYISRTKKPSQ